MCVIRPLFLASVTSPTLSGSPHLPGCFFPVSTMASFPSLHHSPVLCLMLCALSSTSGVHNPGLAWVLGAWMSRWNVFPSFSLHNWLLLRCLLHQQTAARSLPIVCARDLKATLSLGITDRLPKQLTCFLSCVVHQAFAKLLLAEPHDFYWVSWSIRATSFPQGFILIILKFTEKLKEGFNEHRVFFCLDNILPCLCPVSIFLSHLEVRCRHHDTWPWILF